MQPRSSSFGPRGFFGRLRRNARRPQQGWSPSEQLEERALLSATLGEFRLRDYQSFPDPHRIGNGGQYVTGPMNGDAVQIGLDYVRMNAASLGTTPADIDNARIETLYHDDASGITHMYLRQQINGLDVTQSSITVNVSPNGEIINAGGNFTGSTGAPDTSPEHDVLEALTALVDEFGWEFDGQPQIINREGGLSDRTTITPTGVSYENIVAELKYVATDTGPDLGWEFQIGTLDRASWYIADVSATDLEVEHLADWVANASYDVFAIPLEDPDDGPQTTETDPQDPIASPFGWHDTDGVAGAEFTDTRGNNVNAQEDRNGDDAGGTRPDGGAGLNFNFTFDPSQGPTGGTNESAAITNLFYWNNVVHDVMYQYGFDEASGNFQENNYGNGGVGGDPVRADALDGFDNGVRNNATFLTRPDGQVSDMSMFGFDSTTPERDSDLSAVIMVHEFGHGITNRLTGGAADASALQVFQARSMGEGWSDFFSLMLTQKPTDGQFDAYPVGNYVLGNPPTDPNGGIRDFPYSFDMTISPKTYGDFNPFSAPHPNGEIMAATLWDLNWIMINGDGPNLPGNGYDPDIYNGTGGNNITLQLVMDALKLQPANPSYLDFRDAVLLADTNLTGGANQFAIWTAFARRGMGFSAFDGNGNDSRIREAFDLPPGLLFSVDIQATQIREDAGTAATIARIARGSSANVSQPLLVNILNSDPTEISVPSSVTIPAGRTFVDVDVDAVDDTELDGTQTVSITVSAAGFNPWIDTVDVLDVESLDLSIDATSVREDAGAGATTATLTRSNTDTLPPNLLVSVGNSLTEFDRNGAQIATETIPYGFGARPGTELARDIIVTQGDRVAVYNGTDSALYSQLDRNSSTWTHRSFPGLSTDGLISGSGGVAAFQNFVFLTDMNTTAGPARGLVRFDTLTGQAVRFARTVPGDRLFASGAGTTIDDIVELDPLTGDVLNTFAGPGLRGVRDGMAFDGTNLWYIASDLGDAIDDLYMLDPDTGAVRAKFDVGITTGFDGIAALNGAVYLLDSFLQNDIVVFDPTAGQVVRVLDIDGVNPGVNISGGLAGGQDPNVLYATDTFSDDIYELDPQTGVITNVIAGGKSGDLGLAVLGSEIFVAANVGGDIDIFDRSTGLYNRTIDVDESIGFHSLGGDDVPGSVLSPYDYNDVAMGLDGWLYALDKGGSVVTVFDPMTLQIDRFINLDVRANAIAVGSFGEIVGVTSSGLVAEYDSNGGVVNTLSTGVLGMIDIDLALGGDIIIGTTGGTVVLTDLTLAGNTQFSAGTTTAWVSFASAPGAATGDLVVNLINDDTSEISVPAQVTIPAGSQSITFPVDAVDDALFDGTQTVTITPSAAGYTEVNGDSIDVTDVEDILVTINDPTVVETDGPGATTVTLTRSNSNGPFDFLSVQTGVVTDDVTILDNDTVISTIDIPAQVAFVDDVNVTINLDHGHLGDLDVYLLSPAGTRVELFTDVGGNGTVMTDLVIDDEAPQTITGGSAPFTGRFQPEGSLAAFDGEAISGTWTLEITDDTHLASGILRDWTIDISSLGFPELDVTVVSDDTTEAVPASAVATIPLNQLSVTIPVDAIDDALLDGPQRVTLTASAAGYLDGADSFDVLDEETLSITIDKTEISEADGPNAAVGTVSRSNTADLSSPLTVTLDNRDPSEISIPATVTIPAGRASVDFDIDAVDDSVLDGRKRVRIDVIATGYTTTPLARAFIFVTDVEPVLQVELGEVEVFENAAFVSAILRRTNDTNLTSPLSVSLTSSLPLDATVPPAITIPANKDSVAFTITLHDNDLLDGDRVVEIKAEAANSFPGTSDLTIRDFETLTLTFSPDEFSENDGPMASTGTLTRNNTDTGSALTVALSSSDTSEVTVPATVTIPAGASSATFDVAAVNDDEFDGSQSASITAVASGYIDAVTTIDIADHEPAVIIGPEGRIQEARPIVTWEPVPGATSYQVRIDNLSTGENGVVNVSNIPGSETSFQSNLLLGLGNYRVRVRYKDAVERVQPWSLYKKFNVRTAPTILSPDRLPTDNPPEFSWTAIVDAVSYELRVNNLSTGRDRVVDEQALINTSFTPDPLEFAAYEMFVRATGPNGIQSDWATASFNLLEIPVFLTPQAGPSWIKRPTITWQGTAAADHYDLRVHDLTLGQEGRNFIRDRHVIGTEFTPEVDFEPGHNYALYVRAVTSDGDESGWTERLLVRIGDPPVILAPTNGTQTDEFPIFRWSEVAGTERYDFRVREVGRSANVIRVRNVQGTGYSHDTALTAGKTYRVWVRSVSPLGEKTRWATPVEFTVASMDAELTRPQDVPEAPAIDDTAPVVAESVMIAEARQELISGPLTVNSVQSYTESAVDRTPATANVDSTGNVDAVMEALATADADWLGDLADAVSADTLAPAVEGTHTAATQPIAAFAGLALGLLPGRRRRKK